MSYQRLYQHISSLTSIKPYRNFKNVESLNEAADYIDSQFRLNEFKTKRQVWDMEGHSYQNVIASYRAEKEKRLVIGAHYDVYKNQPGADDNASGVAALLEIAHFLNTEQPNLDYGIDLVSYSLEEPPIFRSKNMGSYVHAKSVADRNEKLIGMISLEMLGHYSHIGYDETRFVKPENDIFARPKDFLVVAGVQRYEPFNIKVSTLLNQSPLLEIRKKTFADTDKNGGPSDHRNYWLFGYPAVMILGTSGERNPHYHKITDTIETIDFKLLEAAVNCCYQMAIGF